eukprot:9907370-Alexandrium_andersonii.AAC.1
MLAWIREGKGKPGGQGGGGGGAYTVARGSCEFDRLCIEMSRAEYFGKATAAERLDFWSSLDAFKRRSDRPAGP